ncbi:hypothetical protein RTBOTA2_000759 [Rhodotorula toruloides]|uniref:Uncharacterized protein n=1 Tax=Rhodotorula toruloides TaxID=5286 RepID=A0A0K3CI29_RHOTO|nr:hypothetical protein RTBOTA2_000759 [Rhodotorula toruloides]PRQ72925.1 hypothetical protein AAT19DRAFT_16849 [Rhodotorula toruloides]
MDQLDPLFGAQHAAFAFQLDHSTSPHLANLDANNSGLSSAGSSGWGQPGHQQEQFASGFSQDDLAWLEQQLSLAATSSPPLFGSSTAPSLPVVHEQAPAQPHAFPPVSAARFHPYQLPPERAQRLRPPGPSAQINLASAVSQQQSPPQPQRQHSFPYQPQHQQLSPGPSGFSGGDGLNWPSFSSFAPSFAPVPAPPTPLLPKPRQVVQYPPHDSPSPLLLPDEPTPPYPAAPHASPATPSTLPNAYSSPQPFSPAPAAANVTPTRRRRRARSAPPPTRPSPSFRGSTFLPPAETDSKTNDISRASQLDELFTWLDAQRWSFSTLFTALSDLASAASTSESNRTLAMEHKRRMEDFLSLDEPLSLSSTGPSAPSGADSLALLREAKRRWALKRDSQLTRTETEKGPDEIVRMWEDLGGLGRKREGNMQSAVRELRANVHDGAVAGSVIRRIINRYGEAYNEAASDIKRLDAALSQPPTPHLTSAPREASVWTGTLVIPSTQADILQQWLMSPARREGQRERGKIDPEHMRIYSSLSPLDLHARGAELCRVLLLRDADCMRNFGHLYDRLQSFTIGPVIAPLDTCGFASYDDGSLYHHAVQTYLQLCVRYPSFREGKDATITILPDLPPPVHPTPLETLLIDRALHAHWDFLRLFLLSSHGGLLRSAVRSFAGVKLSKVDLLSVCDDTKAVLEALEKSKKSKNDRILPYDPSISQIRNAWRQQALWDPTAELVLWSAATTHFLELSALFPQFGGGVRELPGLESLLQRTTGQTGVAAMQS